MAAAGDRLIVRRIAPPDTLGGGVVLDPHARKHGPSARRARAPRAARARRARAGAGAGTAAAPRRRREARPARLPPAALALEARLRAAWLAPPTEAELGAATPRSCRALRRAGRAVRVGRILHYHPDAAGRRRAPRARAGGGRRRRSRSPQLRDDLGTSRKFAQALLEHFDGEKVTRRVGDAHVLRRRA